jgi:nucleoside-diphosphate-sugar epimerase
VIVTGATGFLGRGCVAKLLERGYEVHATTGREAGRAPRAGGGPVWHRVDLLDPTATAALVDAVRPTHLVHAAWFVKHGEFWGAPENLRWLGAGVALAEAFGRAGGHRMVGVGTCAEYDAGHGLCHERDTPTHPSTIYGRCKLAMGHAVAAAAQAYSFEAVWARLFFPYGPGEPAGRLMPSVIDALLSGRRVETTHGHQVRDFIFVEDAAEAIACLVDSDVQGVVNVGTGQPVTLREVLREITDQIGGSHLVAVGARPSRAGEPVSIVADAARLWACGWEPRVDLASGIAALIAERRGLLAVNRKKQTIDMGKHG